jgi:hypothetical protein
MEDFEIISSYSREQALEDGVLVDITKTAKEAGVKFHTAMTSAAYADCVTWTQKSGMQDESGRLWDVAWMFSRAAKRASGDQITFSLYRVPNKPRCHAAKPVKLKAVIGPGDNMEPVITIMLPSES